MRKDENGGFLKGWRVEMPLILTEAFTLKTCLQAIILEHSIWLDFVAAHNDID